MGEGFNCRYDGCTAVFHPELRREPSVRMEGFSGWIWPVEERTVPAHDHHLSPIDPEDYLNPEKPGDLADEIMRIVMAGSIFTRDERYRMRDQIRLKLADAGVRLIIAMEDEQGRCTASSWRAPSRARQPYGPGGFNRCKHTGSHEKHEDEWGNVFTFGADGRFRIEKQGKSPDSIH